MADAQRDELIRQIAEHEEWDQRSARDYARFLLAGSDVHGPNRTLPAIPGYLTEDASEYIRDQRQREP